MDNTNMQMPASVIDPMKNKNYTFKFLSYYFEKSTLTGTFVYQGIDNTIFTEKITFAEHPEAYKGKHFNALNDPRLDAILDRALFLLFIMLGTSYYKAHPTPYVSVPKKLDVFQANFFNKVYQEGLSQYAFQNGLTRDNLAHFVPTAGFKNEDAVSYKGSGALSLQSGGKDSLLVASLLLEAGIDFTPWYVSSSENGAHPTVIDQLFPQLTHKNASVVIRRIDLKHLQMSGGLNGHIPVTFVNEALALVQAILNNQNVVLTSIGQEGGEPHSYIGDLPVNHQWSKTWEAEVLMAEYIKRYISSDIHLGSPIRKFTELRVAELFVNKCWQKFGYKFSSCNEANYKQGANNGRLRWCGNCAKCANTYLLFCPFLAPHILQSLFSDEDLFIKPSLTETFKGLLGVDNVAKPFECVGSADELRFAYHHRMRVPPIKIKNTASNSPIAEFSKALLPQDKNQSQQPFTYFQPLYNDLPFAVPPSSFNYAQEYDSQPFFRNFFEDNRGTAIRG